MKIRKKLFLICIIVIFGFYAIIISYAQGPDDIFNVAMLLYFPSMVTQLIANEGNGIICVDACGPCSAWGYQYILIDGQCVLPSEESCKLLEPQGKWAFDEWTCKPVCKNTYQDNCVDVGDGR